MAQVARNRAGTTVPEPSDKGYYKLGYVQTERAFIGDDDTTEDRPPYEEGDRVSWREQGPKDYFGEVIWTHAGKALVQEYGETGCRTWVPLPMLRRCA